MASRNPRAPCRPISRRACLCAGALGTFGLSLPQLLLASATQGRMAQAKSIILIVPWGGPAQMDTLDLKPDAPAEIRGEFKPIATSVPGIHICEHLPKLARLADQYAIIRSLTHKISTHNSATHYVLTGHYPAIINQELVPASRKDWPCLGSVLARLRPSDRSVPAYVQVPCPLIDNGAFTGGQHGGFLGPAFDPFVVAKDPSQPDFAVPGLTLAAGVSSERLDERRRLLSAIDRQAAPAIAVKNLAVHYQRAYDLLRSSASKRAFDLAQEPAKVRQRYGMARYGQSVLMARRLVEAGVQLCMVCDTLENTNGRWDTHGGNVYQGIKTNLADTDQAVSALLTDLKDRGLLDSTIVAWMGEFGRTPKMNNGGGRDHWPNVYSILLAGGGIRGGQLVGASDARAAFPRDHPVSPEDVLATIYQQLGLPASTVITDALGREMLLCPGKPVAGLA